MPVLGRRDLGRVGFVAVDEPTEELACRRGDIDLQQEMPHDRHAVAAENDALNVFQIQRSETRALTCGPRRGRTTGERTRCFLSGLAGLPQFPRSSQFTLPIQEPGSLTFARRGLGS